MAVKKLLWNYCHIKKSDFYKILKEMSPNPVTIRLLDPPLHEFLPSQKNTDLINLLAKNEDFS